METFGQKGSAFVQRSQSFNPPFYPLSPVMNDFRRIVIHMTGINYLKYFHNIPCHVNFLYSLHIFIGSPLCYPWKKLQNSHRKKLTETILGDMNRT
jgi:hypothetical protein